MKKPLMVALAGVLVLAISMPATASSSARNVTRQYSQPNGVIIDGILYAYSDLSGVVPRFSAKSGETKVFVRVKDDFGQPVRGHIHLDRDGDGELDAARDFCGSTSKPLSITPRSKLEVWVVAGTCPEGTPAVATSGTVTAIFRK